MRTVRFSRHGEEIGALYDPDVVAPELRKTIPASTARASRPRRRPTAAASRS
jgi:hypothetical protein